MKNINYKMMKKAMVALLMLLTLSLNAQNDGVIKFLGIPVDGTKEEMISKLKQKGFTFDNDDMFEGEFNGERIYGEIRTYNDKVYSIRFIYNSNGFNKSLIINRFNSLVLQFETNEKYISNIYFDKIMDNIETYLIDTYENIGVEMKKGKIYKAQYFYRVDKDPSDTTGYYQYKKEAYLKYSNTSLKEEDRDRFLTDITSPEAFYFDRLTQDGVQFYIIDGKAYDNYNIMFDYYNLRNAPNGKDL